MEQIYLRYSEAEKRLEEGDVLLFQGRGISSFLIKKAGQTKYSHTGVVSRWHDQWECIEFREWKGGRSVNLKNYLATYKGEIDLYRCSRIVYVSPTDYIPFNGLEVTKFMRKMTGHPYGWKYLLRLAKLRLPLIRWVLKVDTTDIVVESHYHICSTAISHAFSVCGYDLVKNKNDLYVEPADLARSAILHYQFTFNPHAE